VREPTIARNYAEALFEAGEHAGQTEHFADLLEAVAGAIEGDHRIYVVLDSPQVPKAAKEGLLAAALRGRAPEPFIRFLGAVVRRGRQGLIPGINVAYHGLLDQKLQRVHAGVVLARKPDRRLLAEITRRLSAAVRKEVIVHAREDPRIMGGVIVRIGDRVMDGSVRRKMLQLRKQMLGA
jgi:F-type H+-transporting ATPase subunit delta